MEFRYRYFPFDESPSLFESRGKEHGDGSVKEGDASPNFAGKRVEVVRGGTTNPSGPCFVLTCGEVGYGVTKT